MLRKHLLTMMKEPVIEGMVKGLEVGGRQERKARSCKF